MSDDKSLNKVAGLDAIRFLCALWVAMGHVSVPPLGAAFPAGSAAAEWATRFSHIAISGPAAVIVFFVISGFCIHYPFQGAAVPAWRTYFVRRYLRIAVPLVAAVGVGLAAGVTYRSFEATILWSLFAELIYYTLYPVLRRARARWGWTALVLVAFAVAFALALSQPAVGNYPGFGVGLTWLLGLPCWLLGCRLAEVAARTPGQLVPHLWAWRVGVWAASVLCLVLRFRTPIGYPLTLNPFAVLVFFWLAAEIRHFKAARPWGWLEWAGGWSYSLYLLHVPAVKLIRLHVPLDWPPALRWAIGMGLMLLIVYVFHRLVERPSHALARALSRGPALNRRPLDAAEGAQA